MRYWFCALLALAAFWTVAQPQPPVPDLDVSIRQMEEKLEERQGKPADIRLVIDVSGSMKRNDPNNLRQPAVELLMQLLPEDSKAGVWTFGKWVNMLVPHKEVNQQWRESGRAKASEINSVGLFTNIGEALEKAAYDADNPPEEYATSIILLTDGMVDIDKDPEANAQEWRRIVDEVLPQLKEAGYVVHTVALSDNADQNLLNKISLQTDGLAEVAHTADDLMKIFLKAFDASAPAEQVPLTDNQFVIDSSVEEFTALIFRTEDESTTKLVGPDQTVYSAANHPDDVNWHREQDYDLITVQQPLEGEWGVDAEMDDDSRITVVSNLNLRVRPIPNNVFVGHEQGLDVFLQEDGSTITRPEFLGLMDVSAQMQAGRSEEDLQPVWSATLSGEEPPADGIYRADLPVFDKPGQYRVNVKVDGKSFVREFTQRVAVRQPFTAEVEQRYVDGQLQYFLTVTSHSVMVDIDMTQVAATVQSPDRRRVVRPLDLTDMDTWELALAPDMEGEYRLDVRVKGETTKGEPFETAIDDVQFNYSAERGFVEEPQPFHEPAQQEPEPEPAPEPDPEPETEPQSEPGEQEPASQSTPPWLLYTALALGNLLLFGGGFFLVKKILGGDGGDELLEKYSEENVEQATAPSEASPEAEDDEDEDEEPPMEDLDPSDEEPPVEDADEEPERLAEEGEPTDDFDDLDEMTLSQQQEQEADTDNESSDSEEEPTAEGDEEQPSDDEDDEMVAEMLRAQGLDLADEELDDAISSLIDDLEDDDDEDFGDDENKT